VNETYSFSKGIQFSSVPSSLTVPDRGDSEGVVEDRRRDFEESEVDLSEGGEGLVGGLESDGSKEFDG